VLNNACVAGDVVVTQGYTLSSIANALPSTGGTVTGATTFNSSVTINGASASGYTGYKNRIINGGMVIDQRNAGASVTGSTSTNVFPVDRWFNTSTQNSKLTLQQNAGSVTPPTGYKNYVGVTSSSAYSVLTSDAFTLAHRIEGYNTADLGFGTASAATVTLSFWVRSSLTGTFGGVFGNNAINRSYPFTYTISAANTWEQKSITVVGDTTGTWATDNTTGLSIYFGLGAGATYSGTAGAWAGTAYLTATGATSVVGTSGATWYVTGVQLERGSNATSFEFRDYGRELIMCQRYAYVVSTTNLGSTPGCGAGVWYTSANAVHQFPFPVTMRTAPTFTNTSAILSLYTNGTQLTSTTGSTTGNTVSSSNIELYTLCSGTTVAGYATSTRLTSGSFTFSAEL
jgi:hypothetical protein